MFHGWEVFWWSGVLVNHDSHIWAGGSRSIGWNEQTEEEKKHGRQSKINSEIPVLIVIWGSCDFKCLAKSLGSII